MTKVKICGLSEIEHAVVAAEAGADFVGVVFAESHRKVTPGKAREISKAIQAFDNRPQIVGVFADHSLIEINRIAEYCSLDRVQLSGDEPWQFCLQIARPVTKTIHVSADTTVDQVLAEIAAGQRLLKSKDFLCLLDTKVGSAGGGTGERFDWQLAKQVASQCYVLVAGGLNPANVYELVKQVRPWGVDVSSGVETNGRKDPVKIRAFIEVVKRTSRLSRGAKDPGVG